MRKIFVGLLLGLLSCSSFANEVKLEVSLSPAGSFEASLSKVNGKLSFKDGKYSAEKLSVNIKEFKTGISLRDDHFQKFLKGTSKTDDVVLKDVVATGGKGTGVLIVNNTEKKIEFTYKQDGKKVEAKFTVNYTDFKFEKAEYMGVSVDEEVPVTVILNF